MRVAGRFGSLSSAARHATAPGGLPTAPKPVSRFCEEAVAAAVQHRGDGSFAVVFATLTSVRYLSWPMTYESVSVIRRPVDADVDDGDDLERIGDRSRAGDRRLADRREPTGIVTGGDRLRSVVVPPTAISVAQAVSPKNSPEVSPTWLTAQLRSLLMATFVERPECPDCLIRRRRSRSRPGRRR